MAQKTFEKEMLFRRWASGHGDIYRVVTEKTPPEPNLPLIPDRDIMLPSGEILTLMNSACMIRQIHESISTESQILGHLTSLKPLRGQNAPDEWEKGALLLFEKGSKEQLSIETMHGKPYPPISHVRMVLS